MAPLVLEGETLGQKHQYYNKLVKAAVDNESIELQGLNYEEPDVDNLLRIDVACSRRNVDYILNVLQSDDMLYVSRAIKQSKWLITDDQYAQIINPQHLHTELFPKMTTKAKNKLMLAIRLNLKNEARVEDFFNYYKDNIEVAQKWLPYCSLAFIEKVYTEHANEISSETFKRLCEISINVLKILIKVKKWQYVGDRLGISKILLKRYAEEYLEIVNKLEDYEVPKFGIRTTRHLMKHCPEKIINNFQKYGTHIHLPTFAKCMKKDDIPDFLTKIAGNNKMKHWIKYENIKYFAKYLPIDSRFEFIKKLFINKEVDSSTISIAEESDVAYCSYVPCSAVAMRCKSGAFKNRHMEASNAHVYRWYRFAPFEAAFPDLKKLIRVESSPAERNAMLTILISCARRNPQHVQTLLQYYREKHMNEPFKFKVQFVNTLLSSVSTFKFDENTWSILDNIFASMDVYIESENSVPYCLKAIMVYKLLHKEVIPDIIEKKYTFDTFKDYYKKLNEQEREVVFEYLYTLEMKKLQSKSINNEIEMSIAFELLSNVLSLLKEWNRKIADYPWILEKIKHFIKIKKEKAFNYDLSSIYEKKWRRHLFEESLALVPGDEACVHVLKHNPNLLERYRNEIIEMHSKDAISLKQTLIRLRIYWAQTISQKWAETYMQRLEKTSGYKATVEGICFLLPRAQFQNVLEKYTPVDFKIDWSNTDTAMINLQKNIAMRMRLIRPSISLDSVLAYAKDDYLQFAMPSLNAILYNMSASQVSQYIPKLFDSPVSLQKHGLRLAYNKLKFEEIKALVINMWKNTKNSSIKTVLFKETFELLKKEKKELAIKELWELLSMFIDNLNPDENRLIYNTLGKAESVPLIVRPHFFMKSYIYLKSLPAKANCEGVIKVLNRHAPEIIEHLEDNFVEDVLLKPLNEFITAMAEKPENFDNNPWEIISILTSYILSSKDEVTQHTRYEKYLVPILTMSFKYWNTIYKNEYVVRNHTSRLLRELLEAIKESALKKSAIIVEFVKDIKTRLRTDLTIEENYSVITYWSIATLFVESLSNYLNAHPKQVQESNDENSKVASLNNSPNEKWQELCTAVAPQFGEACLNFLKHDIVSQISTLSDLFVRSLTDVFDQFDFDNIAKAQTLKQMLDKEVTVSYLVVLYATKSFFYDRDEKLLVLIREMYALIKSHPSTEVKIYYHQILESNPSFENVEKA